MTNWRWWLSRKLVGYTIMPPKEEGARLLIRDKDGLLVMVELDAVRMRSFLDPSWKRAFGSGDKVFYNRRPTRTYVTARVGR